MITRLKILDVVRTTRASAQLVAEPASQRATQLHARFFRVAIEFGLFDTSRSLGR